MDEKVVFAMKAMRFSRFGGPDVLELEEVPVPVPGPGEVRVRVAATSFNGVDGTIRAGAMQGPFPVALPHVPGADASGVVDELGEGVTGLVPGEAVIGFLPMLPAGASADFVIAPAEVLVPAPASIPLVDAAALPLVGLTAWQALVDHAMLRAGQRVLVVGAGGAVGGYAVQLAAHLGAHVIATASARSRSRVERQGAARVVDHADAPLVGAVTEPVDVVLNLAPLDPAAFARLPELVRDGGVVVSTTVWMTAPSDEVRGVRGVDVYVRSDAAQLAQLVALVDAGVLHVDVAERVPLAELGSVHEAAAEGRVSGKVVVVVDGGVEARRV